MATLCRYCGRVLQDGEICTCPQAQAEAARQYQGYQQSPQGYQQPPQGYQQSPQGYQQPPQGYPQGYQQPAAPSSLSLGMSRLMPFLKSYTKAPVSAVQSLVRSRDTIVACVLLFVQVIICGLLLFSGLDSMVESVKGSDRSDLGTIAVGAMALFNDDLKEDEPSFGMSFLMGILTAVICVAVYVLVIFAAAQIAGSRATFSDALIAAGGHSFYVTVLLLLSFITFFMLFELGAILLVAAMLTWIVLTGPAVQSIAPPNTAKEGSLWICTALGVSIAVVFCGWIFSMMMAVPFK